jgi:TolA-binding protein
MVNTSGRIGRRHRWGWLCLLLGVAASASGQEPKPAPKPATPVITGPGRAVVEATPELPAGVAAAMQGGKYDAAIAGIDAAMARGGPNRSYFALIKGTAQRLAGHADDASRTWNEALKAEPAGVWASKLRFELARAELAAGRPAAAEALARVDAVGLLAGDRKDRLAGVYEAFARRLLRPDDAITPPDPAGAYALFVQARTLAKGAPLRARLLLDQARAAQASGNFPQAITDYRGYLEEPGATERPAARFSIGECQFSLNQLPTARLTWLDLATALEKANDTASASLRARALYQVAKTHGVPNPPDEAQLDLGVAALRRFLDAYSTDPKAVRASYEIGASYLARGRSDAAIAALTDFLKGDAYKANTDESRRDLAVLSMTATYQVAQALQGQGKFDAAIAAWRGYLAKYPDGPQSADAQRAIIDTSLLIANEALARGEYIPARAAWASFVAANPLDSRVPQVLFQVGESLVTEEKFDEAITAWGPLLSKFPGSEPAAHAQFMIASIYEATKGDLAQAVERFKAVTTEPWRSAALGRVAVMESKELTVVTPRAFRSGETPHLKITSRNLESLTFSAYRLDAEAYFRKKQVLGGVESLDVGLVAPDAEWKVPVPGYGKYKPVQLAYDLKVKAPGVWVVKVTDETHLQATTLVLGSDLDAIVKSSREQLLVFAQDMKTGKGRPNARVLVSDGTGVILEKKTGADGVLLADWEKPREANSGLHYLVLDGADAAGTGLGVPAQVAQGLSSRAYIYTDRPAYRPGQSVSIRGVVREIEGGQYANPSGQEYGFDVYDARGRALISRPIKLSSFGTFHETLALDSAAPVGSYRVRLHRPGKPEFNGVFEVQSYRLEKVDLVFDLPKTVYFRGEKVSADLIARYQYGAPVAGRPIEVSLPDGRTVAGQTDKAGKYHVEFATGSFSEEQTLRMVARLPQDNVAAVADLMLAIRAFRIDVSTNRVVYLDGESFAVKLATVDAQGKPIGEPLTLSVLKRIERAGRVSERQASEQKLISDAKTGEAQASVKVDDADGGTYVIRVSGKDRFGNVIHTDRIVSISGAKDQTRLRILADRLNYKVGETAEINLHSRDAAGPALIAWEADRVLQYRLVDLNEGPNRLTWAVEGPQFPNFTLTAARMSSNRFDEARLDVRVERDLRVSLRPRKPAVTPGEVVEVDVETVDQMGKPVAAELSVALVDRSLLRLFNDTLPAIGPYFYNQSRTGAFATTGSNMFHYDPQTTPVAEAVVEEAARERAAWEDRSKVALVREEAKAESLGLLSAERAPQAPGASASDLAYPAPANGMMGGMGGAMGDKAQGKPDAAYFGVADIKSKGFAKDSYGFARKRAGARDAEGLNDFDAVATQSPRQRFVETAYWNPSVVTGAKGKATVAFKAPAALSEYRFTARGVTGAETLVGQATAELIVKKDFFVDLKTPSAFAQGDRPRFIAEIHHMGLTGPVAVSLTVYAGGKQSVYPKALTIKADGVDEVAFDPFDVPEGDVVRLTLKAQAAEKVDELVAEVPIRPWGVQAYASASGTASDDATVFVGLPSGRTYENPEMLITIAPTVRRMIVELALGGDVHPLISSSTSRILPYPPLPLTIADRAGELVAASAAMTYLRAVGAGNSPDATRLSGRIRGLVSELITLQNDDGGWPWVAPSTPGTKAPSDRMTSVIAALAFRAAWEQAAMVDAAAYDRAANYIASQQGQVEAADLEMRTMIQYAMASLKKGSFESANALNRVRQSLPDAALAELALTLATLERPALANEVLDLLASRAKTEAVGPGAKPRTFWAGANQRWHSGSAETTAIAALAFAKIRPRSTELAGAVEWLLAHRDAAGWQPHRAQWAAVSALAVFYGAGQPAGERYRLVVTVNETEVFRADVAGGVESKAVAVPRKALKVGDANRVRFAIEGRGTFGYTIALTGFSRDFKPEQENAGKAFVVQSRSYLPAAPELDGKTLPTGFSVAINPKTFTNRATQVGLGGRAQVEVDTWFNTSDALWAHEYLVVEETLPAGTTFIEGSLQSSAQAHTLADGVLTLYYAPGTYPGKIRYDIYGYLPGQYRSTPTSIRSAYEPSRRHLGPAGDLRVLSAGEASTDSYRATPDELYARGKALSEAGRSAEAAGPLEELFAGYVLRDDVLKDVARRLLSIHIRDYQPRKVVQDFEVLKEKAPELIIPFDEVAVVGRAYRDIGEHERAYLVWRAIVEASYLEDAQVGQVLRQKGRTLDAIATLIDLWREYPDTASIEADFFGISQILAVTASKAETDPTTRKELANAGVTRSQLLLQSIRLIRTLLAGSPTNPLADEASLALIGAYLELGDFESVVKLSERFASLYPKSPFFDSFQYSEALGRFHLGEYDRAIEVANKISKATYKDAAGVDQPSPNKWQAIYILGQIHDARRRPAEAVAYYKQVADRFTDAAGAVKALTRKDLRLPEVTIVRTTAAASGVKLDYRNIAEADVKVYPVDLMRLYLTRRNLDAISAVDLAGITPLHEAKVKLGDGLDFDDKSRQIELPLKKEGAYLAMIRGENLYASGIVLVSPLELEVLEEPESGRVRVTARDAQTKAPASGVLVKVIGTDNASFLSGSTDLRGVFVAEGVRGQVTAVARRDPAQYAFYRGKTYVGRTPEPSKPGMMGNRPMIQPADAPADLGKNLKQMNSESQIRQIERLENRYKDGRRGIKVQEAR